MKRHYVAHDDAIDDAIAFVDYMATIPLYNVEVWMATSREHLPEDYNEGGWYATWWWWYCEPGCLSNDYPHGPYKTEQAATIAAYVEQYELHLQEVT